MPRDGVPRLRRTGRRAAPWPVVAAGVELMLLGGIVLLTAALALVTRLEARFDGVGLLLLGVAGAVLVGTGALVRRRFA